MVSFDSKPTIWLTDAPSTLRTPIVPLMFSTQKTTNFGVIHIALKPETQGGREWQKAIARMGQAWKELYPNDDFEYHFFDESIAKFYVAEERTSTLLTWATGLSIFISCLGLLGHYANHLHILFLTVRNLNTNGLLRVGKAEYSRVGFVN